MNRLPSNVAATVYGGTQHAVNHGCSFVRLVDAQWRLKELMKSVPYSANCICWFTWRSPSNRDRLNGAVWRAVRYAGLPQRVAFRPA